MNRNHHTKFQYVMRTKISVSHVFMR